MILVTGGSGLVGNEIITQLLLQGKRVKALYHHTPLQHSSSQLQQIQCDILDVVALEEAMQGIEQVYHCAALVSFDKKDKQRLYKINAEGTANVVNAALINNVKKLVHVSSVAALGRSIDTVHENTLWIENNHNSNYAKSKYLAELEVWRGVGEGLDAIVINPTVILGAGNWNSGSSKIFKTVYNEFPWYSNGTNGFVDVRDVAQIAVKLMESNISNQRFIVNADNKTYKQIFDLIANAFNKKQPHKLVTPTVAALVWRLEAIKSIFTKKPALVTKETAHTALSNYVYDNNKLLKYLPDFSYTPLEDTIAHTCKMLLQKQS